jgi:hypothetical protein
MRGKIFGGAVLLGAALTSLASVAHAVVIQIGSGSGAPGDVVPIDVTLATEGSDVLATQNRIDFTRQAYIAAREGGEPDCAVNPDIDKSATAFRFLPLDCDPAVDCTSVRTFVLSFGNLVPIDDGARLYTCRVQLAADAAAESYPLTIAEAASSAAGGVLLPTSGTSGAVTAVPPPAAKVVVGSASGEPGDTVQIGVTLSLLDPNAAIVGVQVDVGFDPAAPIAAKPNEQPDCTVHPAIGLDVPIFAFTPAGCTAGDDCTGLHALVIATDNTVPFPDGAALFTCAVAIGAETAAGSYPLTAGETLGGDADGMPVPLGGVDGAITVEEPPPPPPACAGDCDGSGEVSINELLLGVNIVVNGTPLDECTAMDTNGDGVITVNELIQAVNVALGTCPQ